VLGLILGIALLVVAARGIDFAQVGAGIAQADLLWVALAFLAVLLTTAAKIGRWCALFPGEQRPHVLLLGGALLAGQMANALLPARVGDIARAYLAGTEDGAGTATTLGTVAAEKVYDVFFLLLAGALAAGATPLPPWADWGLLTLSGTGLAVILGTLAWSMESIVAWWQRRLARHPGRIGDRVLGLLQRFASGLRSLRSPWIVLRAGAWSAAVWTLAAGTNYLLFLAFGLPLSFGPALLLLVVLHVGVAPPSSPGKLGVFHALVVLSLEFLGVERSLGLAYGALLHAVVYLPQIVLGAVSLVLVRRLPRRPA
jgi:uncharacterized protein (TIRG00374 family)